MGVYVNLNELKCLNDSIDIDKYISFREMVKNGFLDYPFN